MRPFRLGGFYAGRDCYSAESRLICAALLIRGDLMTRQSDEGAVIPVVFEIGVRFGRSVVARCAGRLDWFFRPFIRCDAGEIAERLAGASDGNDWVVRKLYVDRSARARLGWR